MMLLDRGTFIGLFEIVVLAVLFYYSFLFFRGTRSVQVIMGVVILLAFQLVTRLLRMDELNWLLRRFSVYLAIALLVVFQPEIRRALAELGKTHVFSWGESRRSMVDSIVQAIMMLAERKVGALIAIEQEIGTRAVQETGVRIDARLAPELLAGLFFPHTPLHDGGVILRDGRITAAGCVFPLTQRTEISKGLGTRHRAAMGLTEETDAVVVVVSEESGTISVSYRGRLSRGLDEERLRRMLTGLLTKGERSDSRWTRVKQRLDLTPAGIAKAEEMWE